MRAVILVLLTLILPATTLSAQQRSLPIAWLSDRDGDYDVYVWDGDQTINVSNNNTADDFVRQSPAGHLAWVNQFDINVWDGADVLQVSQSPDYDLPPVWSNDGRLAWYASTDQAAFSIHVWDGTRTITLGEPNHWTNPTVWNGAYSGVFYPSWSSDSRLAWFAFPTEQSMSVYVWDGNSIHEVAAGLAPGNVTLAWSPSGALAWMVEEQWVNAPWERTLAVWDGTQITTLVEHSLSGISFSWSRDGRLAFTAGDRTVMSLYIWDRTEILEVSPNFYGFYYQLSWSEDGQLAWIAEQNENSDIFLWDGHFVQNLTGSPIQEHTPLWLSDGRLLWHSGRGSAGIDLQVWDGNMIRTITPQRAIIFPYAYRHAQDIVWVQYDSDNAEIYRFDGEQIINVSHDPATDAFEIPKGVG